VEANVTMCSKLWSFVSKYIFFVGWNLTLSWGSKCYHVRANVIMLQQMIFVIKAMKSYFGAIKWCFHLGAISSSLLIIPENSASSFIWGFQKLSSIHPWGPELLPPLKFWIIYRGAMKKNSTGGKPVCTLYNVQYMCRVNKRIEHERSYIFKIAMI
jgi:hypothetical protein